MLLFKKSRDKRLAMKKGQSDMRDKGEALKKRIASYLQLKSEAVSAQTKKYSLIFFCLFFGGGSIAIIVRSATTKEQKTLVIQISKPAHLTQDEKSFLKADSLIRKNEFDKVEQFKTYLIQLKNDSARRSEFDSIIQSRPHLIDSINLFEKMYLQQK